VEAARAAAKYLIVGFVASIGFEGGMSERTSRNLNPRQFQLYTLQLQEPRPACQEALHFWKLVFIYDLTLPWVYPGLKRGLAI
jgi:hypothetical protein